MLDYFFSAALPDFFKEQSTRCRSVIKGYLKKDNTFTKEDMLQGVALCTKSPASSEHHHRSKMNLKNKSTNSYKKVLCVIITVFPHGASGHYSPRVTWLLVLSSLMPQIHLVDHIIPSFRKWLTPPESLHILTTVLSFLMAAGAWNEVRFPDSGMRCSAMTTGKKHRPWLLPGQLDHGSWWPHGLYHWSGSTPTCHVVFFWFLAQAASFPRFWALTFFSTPSNTSSQVSESAWHLPVFSLEAGSYTKIVKAQIFPPAHILSAEPSFEYSPCLVPYIGNDSFWNWDSGRFAYRTHWKAI